jgi:hypothetical protein
MGSPRTLEIELWNEMNKVFEEKMPRGLNNLRVLWLGYFGWRRMRQWIANGQWLEGAGL